MKKKSPKSVMHYFITPFQEEPFNKCLANDFSPKCFKIATAAILFNGEHNHDLNCYRPISLFRAESVEKIISIRVVTHFDMFNLLSQCQFGFRKSFTTEFAFIDTKNFLSNLDNDLTSCAIFFDLVKAFDSASYDVLPRKLQIDGITGI